MRTDEGSPQSLFLFAHQDDEFGVFGEIESELRDGRRIRCAYVTDGSANVSASIRDAESLAVLGRLGVQPDEITFMGPRLGVPDGKLHCYTTHVANWLRDFLREHPQITRCFVPAWEGGHPDHDVLHAIAVELISSTNNSISVWQYPLYNGMHRVGPFFRVLSPLPENGPVNRRRIPWPDRLRHIRLCMSYPSQWRTWLGIFPFTLVHYIFNGTQQLQKVDIRRLLFPPHARPLYYERRGFLQWETLRSSIENIKIKN